MKIKILSALLSIVMLASLFTACEANDKPKTNPKDDKVEYEGIVIDNEYSVIRGEKASKSEIKSASYLHQQINTAASLKIGFKTDFYRKAEEISEKEILVGKTNRETVFDRTTLREGEYYIGIEGSKIIIDAYDAEVLHFAVREFASKWLTTDLGIQKDGVLLMNEDICASLNGLNVESQNAITILSQNIRNTDDGNGNDIIDRAPRFKKLVDEYDPDIIGMQEDNDKWKPYLKKYFAQEYEIVGTSEVNCIMFKKERFELLENGRFWLSDTPDKASKVPESIYNRICTWALLKDKQTGKTILMSNTHFDHLSTVAREKQARILIDYLTKKFPDQPIFITGDFNSVPTSLSYGIINGEFLDAHDEALVDRSNVECTYPAYEGKPIRELDYCFFNDRSTAVSYYIVNDDYNGCVSDHYGLLTKFVVN